MNIEELLTSKTKKAKEKVLAIGKALLDGTLQTNELVAAAQKMNDSNKATCIEAMEFATKQKPAIADDAVFAFVTKALTEDAPRVKWESAKVIGNIAHIFPSKLSKAIANLLINAEHEGTVVRWAAAFALGEILKLKLKYNKDLLPAIEALHESEQENGVKKKYLEAIKKTKK